jgi:hypothetical protein
LEKYKEETIPKLEQLQQSVRDSCDARIQMEESCRKLQKELLQLQSKQK